MKELVGEVVGNYRVESLIGEGGMGRVYRARHVHLDRLSAIKIMLPELEAIPGYRARFLLEARAAAALRHPNIVEVYECGEQGGRFFLAMELVPDGDLLTAADLQSLVKRGVLVGDAAQNSQQATETPGVGLTLHTIPLGVLAVPPEVADGEAEDRGQVPTAGAKPEVARLDILGIRVFDQAGQSLRLLDLTGDGLTVGKLPDNDLSLDSEGVSRHHLRVDWDGSEAFVTDLGSRNGTFRSDGTRLSPGTKHRLVALEPLQVGTTWLRLETSAEGALVAPPSGAVAGAVAGAVVGAAAATAGVEAATTVVGSGSGATSGIAAGARADAAAVMAADTPIGVETGGAVEAVGAVELSLEPVQLKLSPGLHSSLLVRLCNQGDNPERLGVVVERVPATWVKPGELGLVELGGEGTLELAVQVPLGPASRPGDYPVVVRPTSSARRVLSTGGGKVGETTALGVPAEETVTEAWQTLPYFADGRWTVSELAKLSLVLLPDRLKALRVAEYQVRLENEGNTASTFDLSAEEIETNADEVANPDGKDGKPRDGKGKGTETLVYAFSQPTVSLQPGQTTEVTLRVRAPSRLVGVEETHPFEVRAITDDAAPPLVAKGELVRRALLPFWAFLAASILFALSAVAVLAYSVPGLQPLWNSAFEGTPPTPTLGGNLPSPTALAVVLPIPTNGTLTPTSVAGLGTMGTPSPETAGPTSTATGQSKSTATPDLYPTIADPSLDLTPTTFPTDTPSPFSTATPTPGSAPGPGPGPASAPTPTRTKTPCPAPKVVAFSASPGTIIAGQSSTLSWEVTGPAAVSINQGVGGVAANGTKSISPGSSTTYTLSATGCGGSATKAAVVTVKSIPLVSRTSPASGAVLRVYPRVATFNWSAVSSPAGLKYNIEIEWNGGTWASFAQVTGLTGTSYTMRAFPGDNQGRWRVWATAPGATEGPRGDWWYFRFNTSASQYSASWVNENSATNGITRIIITNSGQTLYIHPYGKCSPTDCDWGTKSVVFDGEPIQITFNGDNLSITLDNAGGTRLRVVDRWTTQTWVYYFHK